MGRIDWNTRRWTGFGETTARLDGRWLGALRVSLWLGVVLAFLAVYTLDLGLSYALISRPCDGPDCHYQALGLAEAQALAELGLSPQVYALYMLGITVLGVAVFCGLALVMLWRLYPRGWGFLFSAMLIIIPTTTITSFDVVAAAFPAWSAPVNLLFILGLTATITFFLVFPNGRLAPRGVLVLPFLMIAANLASRFIESLSPHMWFAYMPLFFAILVVVVYRYRRLFNRLERQQTRWVVFGCALFLAGVPIWAYTFDLAQPAPGQERLLLMMGGWTLINLLMLALPATIFTAILRYRLWDIDLILRKTLVYSLLTALLVGIYYGVVVLLQTLFAANAGQNTPLANVISTLIIAALFQPVRDRLQRAVNRLFFGDRDDPYVVLSKLGQQLQETAAPDQTLTAITATLCQALKLPYAAIDLQGADGERIIAASSGDLQAGAREWPLRFQGLPAGWLVVALRAPGEEFTKQEERLLADVASHAGAAAHAAQLTSILQHSREKLVLAREEERRRIRRDLHDGLGPTLASQTFALDSAIDLLDNDPLAAAELLRKIKAQNQTLVADIRRLVYELRPPTLDELGLAQAIEALIQQLNGHSTLQVCFTSEPNMLESLPAAVEVAVYRLVQEGVNNVMRHAQASTCKVACSRAGDWLTLTIQDDGRGIASNTRGGVGMLSMRERVEELGGRLSIMPVAPSGTLVTAALPTGFHLSPTRRSNE
jgi:signal transduction histidine kinase